ncbi:MAG: C4-type zinc ribbon domain-containing protein [Deltaproteobacteria bacterium]|nr:C4-type zinc ribbon domain-containing protein [Deltaproteobacteria bacterium]
MSIDFKQYLSQLKELQGIDTRIRKIDFELKEIPEQLEASGGDFLALDRTVKDKEGALAAMTKERQELEQSVKEQVLLSADREKRLFAIKTQKEYQATVKEIAQLKKDGKDKEDRILALLEKGEKITAEITQQKTEAADIEGGFRQIEAELKKRELELNAERVLLGEKRPALLKELPAPVLKKYELVKRRYDDAVALVKKGICQGCNMNVPPQFYNEMLKTKDLRECPTCHRLIYVDLETGEQVK